jgi:hypothetical protein
LPEQLGHALTAIGLSRELLRHAQIAAALAKTT